MIAANAGGAWSPIGDVTTTMLWIQDKISASQTVLWLFLPSLVAGVLPLWFLRRARLVSCVFGWRERVGCRWRARRLDSEQSQRHKAKAGGCWTLGWDT